MSNGDATRRSPGDVLLTSMLTVKQPTSSTTLYTVSTKQPLQGLASHAQQAARILSRVFALAIVLLTIFTQYDSRFSVSLHPVTTQVSALLGSPSVHRLINVHPSIGTFWPLAIVSFGIWTAFRRTYTEETLLVVQGLGVQTSTTSSSYLWTSTTRFIPATAVQDIFIHEAFIGFGVKYYLSIVVEDEAQVVVVFPVSCLI